MSREAQRQPTESWAGMEGPAAWGHLPGRAQSPDKSKEEPAAWPCLVSLTWGDSVTGAHALVQKVPGRLSRGSSYFSGCEYSPRGSEVPNL